MTVEPSLWRRWAGFVGLPLLVAANWYLRSALEHADLYLYDFVHTWYPAAEQTVFGGHYPWWRFLLPIRELGGSWTTTTLVVTHAIGTKIGVAPTWYLYNAGLVVVSFVTSWMAFRSLVFSYTFALCMGFGTQLYHSYSVSGSIALVLLPAYYQCVLLGAYKIVTLGFRRIAWVGLFAVATLVMALSYEGWLDFLVFAVLATAVLAPPLWRHDRARVTRVVTLAGILLAVGVVYVVLKTRLGYGQTSGAESDVVLNYRWMAPAIEDVVSNTLTHLYIAATNFLPPAFVSSTALFEEGGAGLIAEQHGYSAAFSYLVPMHYLFLWRYAAGAVAAVCAYALAKCVVSLWRRPSADVTAATVFLVMAITGGPTHALIKFRPMNAAPLVGYHALVGVTGVALLLSYGLMTVQRSWRRRWASAGVVAIAWSIIIYGSLARPAMLDHLAAQVGLGQHQYPDPLRALAKKLGRDMPPAGGAPLLLLEVAGDKTNARGLASEGDAWLPELPLEAPRPLTWRLLPGVSALPADGGLDVRGDSSASGYQLVSPPIGVPPSTRVVMRVRIERTRGRVCAGVLDRSGERWILPAAQVSQEQVFETGPNDRVSLVVANCGPRLTENVPSRFSFLGVTYELRPLEPRR